jgi:hypothetical protein
VILMIYCGWKKKKATLEQLYSIDKYFLKKAYHSKH